MGPKKARENSELVGDVVYLPTYPPGGRKKSFTSSLLWVMYVNEKGVKNFGIWIKLPPLLLPIPKIFPAYIYIFWLWAQGGKWMHFSGVRMVL